MSPGRLLRLLQPPSPGRRLEYFARLLTAGLLVGLSVAFAIRTFGRLGATGRDIELVARQPSAGGWSRDRIVVNQGEHVRLRIRSEDVVHGFAIGRLGVDAGPIEPGKAVTVDFVADRPGEFTFYCTMWCDPNHARMRGILEVRGPAGSPAAPAAKPAADVILQHLDDPRDAGVVPAVKPSAARGLPLYAERCAGCHGERGEGTVRAAAVGRREVLLEFRPVDVFHAMGATTEGGSIRVKGSGRHAGVASKAIPPHATYVREWNDQDRWDVVATLWSLATTADRLELGQRLFLKNCAACHGERGAGDGPGGKSQPKQPADFTDARRMLAGTTALYTAKIRRGGMGTGMPYWGSIFTEEELAAVVDYLWTFTLGRPQSSQGSASARR